MTQLVPQDTFEFYRVPNNFFRGKGDLRGVTPNAVRLYCILEQYRLWYYKHLTITNVDILSSFIKFCNRDDRNKNAIRKILAELQSKDYITIEHDEEELKSNTEMLKITTPETIEGGFEKVTPEIFTKITDHDEFALMCAILKNNNWNRHSVSQDELADSIQCDRKKAARVAERLADKGFITITDGGYYSLPGGKVRKEYNKYKPSNTHKFKDIASKESEVAIEQGPSVSVVDQDQVTIDQQSEPSQTNKVVDFYKGRWGTEEFPKYEDYKIYRDHEGENPQFDRRCEARIKAMREKVNAKMVEEWEKEYETELKKKRRQQAEQMIKKDCTRIVVELSDGELSVYDPEADVDISQVVTVHYWSGARDVSEYPAETVFGYLQKLERLRTESNDAVKQETVEKPIKASKPMLTPQRKYREKKRDDDITEFLSDDKPKSKGVDDGLPF